MKEKRTEKFKRERIHELLAAHGHFGMDYGRVIGTWEMPDGSFAYRQKPFDRFLTGCMRTLMRLLGPLFLRIAYRMRVRGKENLKAIGKSGAVSLCNHFHILDTLFVRQAVGYFRSYHTVAPINNKKGLGGAIMRHGGLLPFSTDLAAMRNLDAEIGRLLSTGKIVNFYPEQALWTHYRPPRPMKRGAFHYAVKFNVPVLPVFCTFRENKRGKLKRLTVHILPPIYPQPGGDRRAEIDRLLAAAEAEWLSCYTADLARDPVPAPAADGLKDPADAT